MFRMRNRVKLSQILSHPKNPRKQLTVDELVESIKETGLLSPLLIRRIGADNFQIISGHRRREALEQMGETYADCDIVEMTDDQAYKALMTANIQAHTLSEVEEAEGIKHMIEDHQWTQDRVAKEFGKSQVWVNRRLDLLNLEPQIQEHIITRVITATHGREIGQLPQEKQEEIVKQVVEEKLSTRETAELVKKINNPEQATERKIASSEISESKIGHTETNLHQFDDSPLTNHQIDDQLGVSPILDRPPFVEVRKEETRLYSDPDMKIISDMNGFILRLKDMVLDLNPHDSLMESLVEFNRSSEALNELNNIEFRLGWIRKHITNATTRRDNGTPEGTVLEFKRKEA